MKKFWCIILTLSLCLCLLSSCGGAASPDTAAAAPSSGGEQEPEAPSLAEDEEAVRIVCRIVDGAESGDLLLADMEGSSVYRLPLGETAVTLDGEPSDAAVLEDGMPVDVFCDGTVLESFPAQFGQVWSVAAWSRGQEQNPTGTAYDLCGLYLQALNDLWETDPALNEHITRIGVDLSAAPGELTESEKAALIWRFGEQHGLEAFPATFAQLREEGVITAEPLEPDCAINRTASLRWSDGCLFSITANEDHEGEYYSLPTVFFNVEKWRSSLGAYYFYDCSAVWSEAGRWDSYTVGAQMIS